MNRREFISGSLAVTAASYLGSSQVMGAEEEIIYVSIEAGAATNPGT